MVFNFEDIDPTGVALPIIAGVVAWFGLNYLFLGPTVIGPRLADVYYTPACMQAVKTKSVEWAKDQSSSLDKLRAELNDLPAEADRMVRDSTRSALGILGQIYGQQGQAFADYYGNRLSNSAANTYGGSVARLRMQKRIDDERLQMEARQGQYRQRIIYNRPEEFCGCTVDAGMADRFELALYTSSLRLYKPAKMRALESGQSFDQCGAAPIF